MHHVRDKICLFDVYYQYREGYDCLRTFSLQWNDGICVAISEKMKNFVSFCDK